MDQLSQQFEADETKEGILKQEREALQKFLDSPEYRAAQTINQKSVDDNVEVIVGTQIDSLARLFVVFDLIADTRAKLNFKKLFTDRLADIDDALKTKK